MYVNAKFGELTHATYLYKSMFSVLIEIENHNHLFILLSAMISNIDFLGGEATGKSSLKYDSYVVDSVMKSKSLFKTYLGEALFLFLVKLLVAKK